MKRKSEQFNETDKIRKLAKTDDLSKYGTVGWEGFVPPQSATVPTPALVDFAQQYKKSEKLQGPCKFTTSGRMYRLSKTDAKRQSTEIVESKNSVALSFFSVDNQKSDKNPNEKEYDANTTDDPLALS